MLGKIAYVLHHGILKIQSSVGIYSAFMSGYGGIVLRAG